VLARVSLRWGFNSQTVAWCQLVGAALKRASVTATSMAGGDIQLLLVNDAGAVRGRGLIRAGRRVLHSVGVHRVHSRPFGQQQTSGLHLPGLPKTAEPHGPRRDFRSL
jgi:hypothetical protein